MEIYPLKHHGNGLHPTLDPFDGVETVIFLSLLSTMCDAFDMLGAS